MFMQPLASLQGVPAALATHGGGAAPSAAPEFNPQSLFALGAANMNKIIQNVCPAETLTVLSSATCELAAAAAGKPYGGSLNGIMQTGHGSAGFLPLGCIWFSVGGSFYFNTATQAAYGFPNPYARPVCAGAPRFEFRGQIWI